MISEKKRNVDRSKISCQNETLREFISDLIVAITKLQREACVSVKISLA